MKKGKGDRHGAVAGKPGAEPGGKGATSRLRRFGRWVARAVILFFFLIGVGVAIVGYLAGSIYWYASVDETRAADAAIVLGAAVYDDRPSPVFRERIRHGIKLYQAGTVKKLIFTGGLDPYDSLSEAAAAREMALEAGVDDGDILLEEASTKTWENLLHAQEIVEREGFERVLIVSDPIHMRRAMSMAKRLGLRAHSSPTKTSMYRSRSARWTFIKTELVFYGSFLLNWGEGN